MTKTELLHLLTRLDLQPSRRLGQNFLIDQNLLEAMVRLAAPKPGESILEVGPGTGVLTRHLLAAGSNVTAVEFDHRLAAYLRDEFQEAGNFRLVEADACRLNYDDLMGPDPYRCIANLPYAASSVLLANFLALCNPPVEMFVLLQREMAERLAAPPATKDYGALSVRIQMIYQVAIARRVPPSVFFPPPAVESAYVHLRLRDTLPTLEFRKSAATIVRAAFSQRRKKLINLLKPHADAGRLERCFSDLGLPDDVRAEAVSVPIFQQLVEALHNS